jgi:transposase
MVKAVGARMPRCDTDNFHIHKDKLPPGLEEALAPIVAQIEHLTQAIAGYDTRLESEMDTLAPAARNLTTIPGVGPVTAVTFALTIDDPKRFEKSRAVGAYLGLVPRRDQSGNVDPQLGITKAGSPQLRRLLVQCAQVLLALCKRSESDLRLWGLKLAGTSQADKRRAVVAVARKLAVLMHRMMVTGKPFDPQHPTRTRTNGGGMAATT